MIETITISAQRSIGSIVMDVTVRESGVDELTITQHPVEQGAQITDHAYKNPAQLSIECAASNSSGAAGGDPTYVQDKYNALLALQLSRQPFTIVTGKRTYQNMLFRTLAITTEETSENALIVSASFQEIIIVSTSSTSLPATANQATPAATQATAQQGTVQPVPATLPTGSGPAAAVQASLALL